jgi:hypothetical protein
VAQNTDSNTRSPTSQYFGRSVPLYFERQHRVASVNRAMSVGCVRFCQTRAPCILGTVQCSGGYWGYDNSYNARDAVVDMTIHAVQWRLLWI